MASQRQDWNSMSVSGHVEEPPYACAALCHRHIYASQKRKSKRKQFSTSTLPNRLNKYRCSFNSRHAGDVIRYAQPSRSSEDILNRIRDFDVSKNTFRNVDFVPDVHSTPNRAIDTQNNNSISLSSDRGEIGLGNFSSIYQTSDIRSVRTLPTISKIIDEENEDLTEQSRSRSPAGTYGSKSKIIKRREMNGVSWIFSLAFTDDPKGRAYRNQVICTLLALALCLIVCILLVHFFGGFSMLKNITLTSNDTSKLDTETSTYVSSIIARNDTPLTSPGASKLSKTKNTPLFIAKLRENIKVFLKSPESELPSTNSTYKADITMENEEEEIVTIRSDKRDSSDEMQFCRGCQKNVEVCMTDDETGIPRCRLASDPEDPTGCGGLCLLEVETCHVLDRRAGVRTCRAAPRAAPPCAAGEWRCANQLCVPSDKRCDGHMNCYDHSDEAACHCDVNTSFHCGNFTSCLSNDKKCNGVVDCWDGSDEINCTNACPDSQFTCTNGDCIPRSRFCDGLPDCADKSDEPVGCGGNCRSNEFKCGNQRCIPRWRRCNRIDDCGDFTDETECTSLRPAFS